MAWVVIFSIVSLSGHSASGSYVTDSQTQCEALATALNVGDVPEGMHVAATCEQR